MTAVPWKVGDRRYALRFLPEGAGSVERADDDSIEVETDNILSLENARLLSDHLRELTLDTGNVYPSIALYSGHMYDFIDVENNVVSIEDVAHSLSHNCRFAGHCAEFYSVAEHSVRASYVESDIDPYAKLMHDAPEAVMHDLPTPLKRMLRDYKLLSEKVETNFGQIFGYEYPLSAAVHRADLIMLATEKRDLKPNTAPWSMLDGVPTLPEIIEPWSPKEARRRFLERYEELHP